jgi:hypothetical protein
MNLKIWNVVDGPLEDEDGDIFNLCLVENDGVVEQMEVYFENMKDAMTMVNYFKTKIEPLELENPDDHTPSNS